MASPMCGILQFSALSASSPQAHLAFPLSSSFASLSLSSSSSSLPGRGMLSFTRKGNGSSGGLMSRTSSFSVRAGYNVQVVVEENEPEEKLLGRFRREVLRAGVIQECKRRRFFENKQEEKKRKTREAAKREAVRRNRRRRPQNRTAATTRPEEPKSGKKDEEEDNWDLPEDLPF